MFDIHLSLDRTLSKIFSLSEKHREDGLCIFLAMRSFVRREEARSFETSTALVATSSIIFNVHRVGNDEGLAVDLKIANYMVDKDSTLLATRGRRVIAPKEMRSEQLKAIVLNVVEGKWMEQNWTKFEEAGMLLREVGSLREKLPDINVEYVQPLDTFISSYDADRFCFQIGNLVAKLAKNKEEPHLVGADDLGILETVPRTVVDHGMRPLTKSENGDSYKLLIRRLRMAGVPEHYVVTHGPRILSELCKMWQENPAADFDDHMLRGVVEKLFTQGEFRRSHEISVELGFGGEISILHLCIHIVRLRANDQSIR